MPHEIDQMLSSELIKNELQSSLVKIRQYRQNECDSTGIKPPRLRFLNTFHSAVYDPKRKMIFEGPWDKMHIDIALENHVDFIRAIDTYTYYSCQTFSLKRARQIKVLVLDTLSLIKAEDIIAIENCGYLPMSPNYHWLEISETDNICYNKIPSVLYPNFI